MTDTAQLTINLRGALFDDGKRIDVASLTDLMDVLDRTDAVGYVEVLDADRSHLVELANTLNAPEVTHRATPATGHLPLVTGDHVSLSAKRPRLVPVTFQLDVEDLHVCVLSRVLVLDHSGRFDTSALCARFETESRHRDQGVGWLLWLLLDELTSESGAALAALDDELDDLEDTLLVGDGKRSRDTHTRMYQLRKSTSTLRRCLLPIRDAVDALLRREVPCVTAGLIPLYQGLYDRAVRQAEWADGLRDLVTALSDTQLAMEGNRLNVIMKKVTSWAAIIAVPAAITGFYGQNVPFPGVGTAGGFWTSAILMAAGCVALFAIFKRKDWL